MGKIQVIFARMSTLKISHLACLKSSLKNSGVVSQMSHEAKIAREIGFDWDVKLWSSDATEDGICKTLGNYSSFFIFRRFMFFQNSLCFIPI